MESGLSNGAVSLHQLAEGGVRLGAAAPSVTFQDVVASNCSGGWLVNIKADSEAAIRNVREYLDEITRVDIATYETGQKPRDSERIAGVIRSVSRGLGSAMKITTIVQDVNGEEGVHGISVSLKTVSSYLEAITKVMILEHLPAWRAHLRSKATLRTSPKYHLADPSLAVAALRATPNTLLADLALLGQVFENLVVRDLLVYAQHIYANVSYYRDSNGLEVDAIIDHFDGSWQAFEIKLGTESIDAAASTLLAFASTVDTSRRGRPRALSVITSTGPAYTRPDGIHVIPITMLGV